MERIEILRAKVKDLYEVKYLGRADWADYLYDSHIFVVAKYARALSERFGVKNDLAEAAAMLHDIADAIMSRSDEQHEEESIKIARQFLLESCYSSDEIKIIVDDAIENHSCRGDSLPQTIEGQIMVTADAKAHLDTDFYFVAREKVKGVKTNEEFKAWCQEKIDRDFNQKIFFPEIKKELREVYEARKTKFC